jgi:hypothetical protein
MWARRERRLRLLSSDAFSAEFCQRLRTNNYSPAWLSVEDLAEIGVTAFQRSEALLRLIIWSRSKNG